MTESSAVNPGRRKFSIGVAVAAVAPTLFWIGKAAAAEQVIVRTPGGDDPAGSVDDGRCVNWSLTLATPCGRTPNSRSRLAMRQPLRTWMRKLARSASPQLLSVL